MEYDTPTSGCCVGCFERTKEPKSRIQISLRVPCAERFTYNSSRSRSQNQGTEKVNRALAAESHAIGFKAAYAKAMAPGARKLDGGQQPAIGRDSILALMARYPAGLSIDWTPEEAVVAESGELGFTWGRYVASVRDSNGKLVVQYGKYLDVWKRQGDGVWRWIADIGNDNPPPS